MALSSLRPDKTRLMLWRDVEAEEIVDAIVLNGGAFSCDLVHDVAAGPAILVIVAKDHGMTGFHQ